MWQCFEVVQCGLAEVIDVGVIVTPRLVTDVEGGMFWPEKVILVMSEERS